MLNNKDYCDYETCVALKELGYDGYCAAYYHLFDDEDDARNSFEYAYGFDFQNSNNIYRVAAPLLYQAQKWLREEEKIEVLVLSKGMIGSPYYFQVYTEDYVVDDDEKYSSYEEALCEGVREAVKILKEK